MQTILTLISAIFLSVFMPTYLLNVPATEIKEQVNLIIEHPQSVEQIASSEVAEPAVPATQTVRLLDDGTVRELPLEEYLVGVVLAEMPASFELEALKAQAVAARTFTLRHMEKSKHSDANLCSDSTCCQAWKSKEALQEKLGDAWPDYWKKAQSAVKETAGEVLTYDGQLIDAVYFSCSGGTTEDAVAVWGTEIPYLQSVKSEGEEHVRKFKSQIRVPCTEFKQVVEKANEQASLKGPPSKWIGSVTRSEGGGVLEWMIGGQPFQGTALRKLFHLNSAKFDLSVQEQEIVFDVYGAGHRVGMSQYGANAMAQAGKNYQEILTHYYTDTKVEIKTP